MGICYVLVGNGQERSPDLRSLMAQVEAQLALHDSAAALRLLRAEVAKNPSRTDLRIALGSLCLRAGEYDEGISAFQSAAPELAQEPKAAGDLYLRIGEAYRRKGDSENAIVNLRRAAELLPENLVAMNTLALVLDGAAKKADAAREYRAILELDPENGVAMNNLAFLLSENGGDLDEALQLASHAHELMPQLDEVSDTLGWINLKMNRADAAIAIFRELVDKQPAGTTYRYHFGMALAEKGDRPAAVEQLRTALKYVPAEELAAKILRLLGALER
jgi:tetratricopeptide (TPR) repeat protein